MPVIALDDLPAALPRRGPLLGLDLGTKTIGVAAADAAWTVASPVELIRRSKFTAEAEHLHGMMQAREVAALVLGLPLNMDGTEGPRAQSARAFGRNLLRLAAERGWAEPVVALWDERLSTAAVNRMLIGHADMTRARRAEVVDKMAAAYILQGALERLRGRDG